MEATIKHLYEAPVITVVEVKTEGIVCASGPQQFGMPGYGNDVTI